MTEFIQANWVIIVSVIVLGVVSMFVPAVKSIFIIVLKTLVSKRMLRRIFIAIAESYVKSTKTKFDDKWFEDIKKELLKK